MIPFDKLFCIVQKMKERPGAFFGRAEYSFNEVIAFLDGYVVALNIYANIDKRCYTSLVKYELSKMYEIDSNVHIIDLFDSICENEKDKVTLLLKILKALNI